LLAGVNLMGGCIFGYNTGVIAGIVGDKGIFNTLGGQWTLSETMTGIVTASILIGALFGSMIGGPIADKFGRKAALLVLSLVVIISAPLLAIADSLTHVIIARGCLGLGVGMAGVVCTMYVSETAPVERKGSLGILFQLAICIGIFIGYVSNYALLNVDNNWRFMFLLGATPAIILAIIGVLIPESPVWMKSNYEGSDERASLVRTNEYGTKHSLGKTTEISRPLSGCQRLGLFIRSKALGIGLVLAVAQQLTGVNAFFFYAGNIFSSAGITNATYPTMGLGAWNVLSTCVAVPLVDRFGRRPLLIVGTSIMTVACFGLGLSYQFLSGSALGACAIVLLLTFVLAFEIGDGPLFWIVAHELFTPETKTIGASTLNAAQWLFNIMLTLGFPIVKREIDQVVFYIFGALGALCTIAMVMFLPETRGTKPQAN